MKNVSLMIALHYIRGSTGEKNISIMIKLCFVSIFISSFALALVMAIMNGFEKATHEKIQGIHAQIIIRSHGQELNIPAISKVLKNEFPQIVAWSPTSMGQAIIQSDNIQDISNIIMIKAIDPTAEAKINVFEQKIIDASSYKTLHDTVFNDSILIGNKLAKNLHVTVGDKVNIVYSSDQESQSRKIMLNQSIAYIGGIFATGIDEFDSSLALISMKYFNSLFPQTGISQINAKLADTADENETIKNLKLRLNLEVYSWKELYPALVSALQLEKYAMFVILILLSLVASMSIISLLFMQITQKKGDIAIFKAMGLADKKITAIFLWMGMSIAFIASICGLALATVASWLLGKYPFISLPDAYYLTHLPSRIELPMLVAVFITCMLMSFIATWLPARRSRFINIAQVLRFEA